MVRGAVWYVEASVDSNFLGGDNDDDDLDDGSPKMVRASSVVIRRREDEESYSIAILDDLQTRTTDGIIIRKSRTILFIGSKAKFYEYGRELR